MKLPSHFAKLAFVTLTCFRLLSRTSVAADPVTPAGTVTVFAAASLKDAFEDIDAAFERENPGVKVVLNLAGSQKLTAQLLAGAPADVFASANAKSMDAVVDGGEIDRNSVRPFTKNWLVAIYSKKTVPLPTALIDLATPGRKLVVADKSVPVGGYTVQMLEKLAADPAYGSKFVDAFNADVVSYETDVRSVLSKVALGEADGGIVYRSDTVAKDAEGVGVIEIPAPFNVEAEYPVAPLTKAPNPTLAHKYIQVLLSQRGKVILLKHGFPAK